VAFAIFCFSVELSDLPSETNSNQLTLSKAAFLQGMLYLKFVASPFRGVNNSKKRGMDFEIWNKFLWISDFK